MSYDIRLTNPATGETLVTGTNTGDGTFEMWVNVTYNHAPAFRRAFGPDGVRTIYGMTGAESILALEHAMARLGDDATDGDAKRVLRALLSLARTRPDGVWDGD